MPGRRIDGIERGNRGVARLNDFVTGVLCLRALSFRRKGIQVSGAAGPSPRYYAQPMMMRAAAANDSAEAVVSAGSADTALTVSLTVRITP